MRRLLLTTWIGLLLVNVTFSLDKQLDCKCRIQTSRRIIGGRNADPTGYPWQISLQRIPRKEEKKGHLLDSEKTKFHRCGGTIVNEQHILTAAHCIAGPFGDMDVSGLQIGYGENDLAQMYNKDQYAQIETAYQHAEFDTFNIENDIAVIKLKEPLEFSKSIQPACLGTDHKFFYDGVLKIAGWGSTTPVYQGRGRRSGVNIPRFLKEGEVYDQSNQNKKCRAPEQNICVANDLKKDSVCLGDSGGPLMANENGKTSVVGVTSFVNVVQEDGSAKICAGISSFTRLSSFTEWLEEIVGDDYCK